MYDCIHSVYIRGLDNTGGYRMVIGICGYGYTGSGAVIDLLKEYKDIQVSDDFEFALTYWPDSIQDLEYHLCYAPARFFSSDTAIRRFHTFVEKENKSPKGWYKVATQGKFKEISEQYINKVTQLTWKGRWMIDPFLCSEFIRTIKYRLLGRCIKWFPRVERMLNRKMYFSIAPVDFLEHTKDYINDLLSAMGYHNSGTVVLNQPFPANEPAQSMKYFTDPRAIIVDRDPRDTYILMKKHTSARWAPIDNVEKFILYYRQLRLNKEESNRVLYLRFEDLVYQYERTVKVIEEFCGLGIHIRPRSFFDPMVSINNTRLYQRYPELDADIKLIEKELTEFLFNFSEYDESKFEGTVF